MIESSVEYIKFKKIRCEVKKIRIQFGIFEFYSHCKGKTTMTKIRCPWATKNPLEQEYHDTEWGVPAHDDAYLFELLILEGQQAGLSWATILAKRETYRKAYDNFDPHTIIQYDQTKIDSLLQDPGIVRNKLKVNAVIANAKAFLDVQKEYGSFDAFIWSFVEGTPILNAWKTMEEVPVSTPISYTMSKALKKKGFKFIGTTTCYAFMQAVGMVNDHIIDCFRYQEIIDGYNNAY